MRVHALECPPRHSTTLASTVFFHKIGLLVFSFATVLTILNHDTEVWGPTSRTNDWPEGGGSSRYDSAVPYRLGCCLRLTAFRRTIHTGCLQRSRVPPNHHAAVVAGINEATPSRHHEARRGPVRLLSAALRLMRRSRRRSLQAVRLALLRAAKRSGAPQLGGATPSHRAAWPVHLLSALRLMRRSRRRGM